MTNVLIWHSMDDYRVCPECKARNGAVFPANTPAEQLPPLHPGCRCFVEHSDAPPAEPLPPPEPTPPPIMPPPIMPPPIIPPLFPPTPTPTPTPTSTPTPVRGTAHRVTLALPAPQTSQTTPRRYAATLIAAGELRGWSLTLPASVLTRDWRKFENVVAFADHPHLFQTPSITRLLGVYENVRLHDDTIVAELVLKPTPLAMDLQPMLDDLANRTPPIPDIGLSANLWLIIGPDPDSNGLYPIEAIHNVESVDVIFQPASRPARLMQVLASAANPIPAKEKEFLMPDPSTNPPAVSVPTAPDPDIYLRVLAQATLDATLHAANLPAPADAAVRAQFANRTPLPGDITDAITQQRQLIAALQPAVTGHDHPLDGRISGMTTPLDQAHQIAHYLFGVQAAPLPEPAMRSPRAFYRAFTGDLEFHGRVNPQHVQFANATTTTLADLAVNAVNKVFMETWEALPAYRWFEPLTTVMPNDGSVNAMAWITFGGIGNLPVVAEGAAYTEVTVADARENDNFTKYGAYLGITEELWRNDDLQRLQMIPRQLAVSALRTRSAKLAAIFTTASGTGPTLDDDGVVLFHTATHGNLATTAYSTSAWKAARLECFKQTELGSSKRMGIWPRFCLVPGDIYDDALVSFGYGAGPGGYPGTANNDTNPYAQDRPGDPRPRVIAVPDWTDTNDWAYLVDPAEYPVLVMSYAQAPGGRTHPMPEIFSVTSPLAGLVFTNDTLPVKVRDWYAYGVTGYRGIGKRNVS